MTRARLRSKVDLFRGMRKAEGGLNRNAALLQRGNLTAAQKIQIRKASAFADAVINAMALLLKTRRS